MSNRKYSSILTLFLVIVLCANLISVQVVHADGETPTEPPVATEVATEAPVQITVTIEPIEETQAPVTEVETTATAIAVPQTIDNTDVVVLDEQGQPVVLGSQDAANALVSSDPVWCPASVSVPTPGTNGCSASYGSIAELLAAMQTDAQAFSQDGTIFLEKTSDQGFTTPLVLDDSNESLGSSYSNLNLYSLTVQGGWDRATGSTSDQTVFSGSNAYVQIGTLTNPWVGSVAINNLSVFGSNQDGIQIFASNAALTNVNASYNDANGVSITASDAGTVKLDNVKADSNGHMEGGEPVGSGVYLNGADTLLDVVGGSFNNNARYGIEALNSTSTTIPIANFWTDQADYAPGSIVTISGNDNNLNGSNIGFTPGETVLVYVEGPNGYTANCQATANTYGGWACQVTLWSSDLAVGDYTYRAIGLTSGVSVTGAFTDARTVNSATLNGGSSVTVAPSATITAVVSVTTNGSGNNARWRCIGWRIATAPGTITNFVDFSPNHDSAGTNSESFSITAPSAPGTYNVYFVAYSNDNCNQGASTPLVLNGAVTVASATPTTTVTTTATSTTTATATTTATSTTTATVTSTATDTATATATSTVTDTATVTVTDAATDTGSGSASTSQDSKPKRSSSSALVVPLTGGELIDLDCNSVFWILGVKLSFLNLCDQQTTIHSIAASDLPAQLPDGFSLMMGLKVDVLTNGQTLTSLPNGSGIEMDFPIYNQSHDQFTLLYWNGSQWVEISQQLSFDKISQVLSTTAPDELYQLTGPAANTFYPILTTDKTGVFVLVKK